jgi:hypothetical protein
MPRDPRS